MAAPSNLADTYYKLVFGDRPTDLKPRVASMTGWLEYFIELQKYRRGYKTIAAWWLGFVGLVIAAAIYLLAFFSPETSTSSDTAFALIGIKVLLLIPLLILLAFSLRSYRINKHLEVVYTHRWALQSAVDEHLALAQDDTSTRQKQLALITPFFFRDIETGHITKKDGLGDPLATAVKVMNRK